MAKYVFYCKDCDRHLEVTRSITECNDPQLCTCGVTMKRLYTPITAIFRGSGWGGKA